MINSMTAFARQETQNELGTMSWELRSVNQRYLDLHFRLPEELRSIEPKVREILGGTLKRGKIESSLRFQPNPAAAGELAINEALAKQLSHASRQVDGLLYNPSPINSLDVLRWPGVLQVNKLDQQPVQTMALELLEQTLQPLVEARRREGASLQQLVQQRYEAMQQTVDQIRQRLPQVRQGFSDRLNARLAELTQQLDPARLEQEVVLLVQKSDIDEELDRLQTHINEVAHVFQQGGACGRRLDFLMQEFNREANTIAAKSTDQGITRGALELKVLIEQAREQIQNIE